MNPPPPSRRRQSLTSSKKSQDRPKTVPSGLGASQGTNKNPEIPNPKTQPILAFSLVFTLGRGGRGGARLRSYKMAARGPERAPGDAKEAPRRPQEQVKNARNAPHDAIAGHQGGSFRPISSTMPTGCSPGLPKRPRTTPERAPHPLLLLLLLLLLLFSTSSYLSSSPCSLSSSSLLLLCSKIASPFFVPLHVP